MNAIEVEPGLSVRFPNRGDDFAEGVEIGILTLLMAQGAPEIVRAVPEGCVDQATVLAIKLGYRLCRDPGHAGHVTVTLRPRGARPALKVVSSR